MEPLLGSCHVIADHTWPEWREATVAEIIVSADVRSFVKRHRSAERLRRELTASSDRSEPSAWGATARHTTAQPATGRIHAARARPKRWSDPELLTQGAGYSGLPRRRGSGRLGGPGW